MVLICAQCKKTTNPHQGEATLNLHVRKGVARTVQFVMCLDCAEKIVRGFH